jgi:hypothetical protein
METPMNISKSGGTPRTCAEVSSEPPAELKKRPSGPAVGSSTALLNCPMSLPNRERSNDTFPVNILKMSSPMTSNCTVARQRGLRSLQVRCRDDTAPKLNDSHVVVRARRGLASICLMLCCRGASLERCIAMSMGEQVSTDVLRRMHSNFPSHTNLSCNTRGDWERQRLGGRRRPPPLSRALQTFCGNSNAGNGPHRRLALTL